MRSLREAGSIYSNALSEFEEGEGQGFGRGDGISDPDSKVIYWWMGSDDVVFLLSMHIKL